MLIAQAMAQTASPMAATGVQGAGEAFMLNMLLIVILVTMFYVLLIVPQQKRFKKHRDMLNKLKKGDEIITSSGFIGVIDKIKEDDNEVVIDLGGGLKVRALRSSIQARAKEDGK